MFIRRTVIAAALIAVPIAFAAPALADTPCSYFGNKPDNGICGAPDLADTFENVQKNLHNNFNPGIAAGHLEYNLTHGVGEDDPAE